MAKVNKDDIGAIVSRIDAQTLVIIALIAEIHAGKDNQKDRLDMISRYTKMYDQYSAKYRKDIIGDDVE